MSIAVPTLALPSSLVAPGAAMTFLSWVLVTALLGSGCGDAARAPAAPPTTDGGGVGGRPIGGSPGDDAAVFGDAASSDAAATLDGSLDGSLDGGERGTCQVAGPNDVVELSQLGDTLPFRAEASFVDWGRGVECSPPRLMIGLGAAGCSTEELLRFEIARASIGTEVFVGANSIQPAPLDDLLRIRLATGGRTYGTCEGASGDIELTELDEFAGAAVVGTFDVTLTPCDTLAGTPIRAVGGFSGTVPAAYEDVCR